MVQQTLTSGAIVRHLPALIVREEDLWIVSSCPKTLGDGQYRCHLDQVLKAVAESVATAINSSKHHYQAKSIMFLRAGEKPYPQPRAKSGLLSTATEWQLEVDLSKQLKFQGHITLTWLRPGMIIVSEFTNQLIMLELMVPWETRIGEADERKCTK